MQVHFISCFEEQIYTTCIFLTYSRFLLDAPESEIGDPISLCFLTELAYWFYLDEYAEEDDKLNNLKFDPFAQQLLNVRTIPLIASNSLHMITESEHAFQSFYQQNSFHLPYS